MAGCVPAVGVSASGVQGGHNKRGSADSGPCGMWLSECGNASSACSYNLLPNRFCNVTSWLEFRYKLYILYVQKEIIQTSPIIPASIYEKNIRMITTSSIILCCPMHKDAGIFHYYILKIWAIEIGKWDFEFHFSYSQITTPIYILCGKSPSPQLWPSLGIQS